MSISAGGAHSACITSTGELYTWGKGRYGRLGHGDSEDQPKPRMVRIHLGIGPVKQNNSRKIVIIFLSTSLNMCFGCSKESSH